MSRSDYRRRPRRDSARAKGAEASRAAAQSPPCLACGDWKLGGRRVQLRGQSVGGASAGVAGRSQLYRFQAVGGLGANVHTTTSYEHVHRLEAARSNVVASSWTEEVHEGCAASFMI